MKDKFTESLEKKENQLGLVRRVAENICNLKTMSDKDIRCYNITRRNRALSIEVKDGISFGNAYSFACEYNRETEENILNEKIGKDDLTLLWSGGALENHIRNRKMTSKQYSCFEVVVDMMKSGKFDDYWSVKSLKG